MRDFGAELVVAGSDFDQPRGHAATLAEQRGLRMVPPMGSGSAGLITVRDLLGLRTEIVGVAAEGAPAFARSFAAGRIETTEQAATFVDGLACRQPDPEAFAVIARGAARIVTVPDDGTAAAMRLMQRATHNLTEPTGAIALAALLQERDQQAGRRVALILTGGNVDAATLATVLAGRTPAPPAALVNAGALQGTRG